MAQDIPEKLILQLAELIKSHIGLDYPKNRWRDLMRNMGFVAKELGFEDAATCVHSLLTSPLREKEVAALIKHLTIGETFFFRDDQVFQAVKDTILPELITTRGQNSKNINFWSAGCCTGEEPYSMAMLIDQMIPSWENWNINILATDLNMDFLQKADKGIYTNWSFRNAPKWIKERYFKCCDENSFEISARIKKMVRFSQLNLALTDYSSVLYPLKEMDVIFCRNVLMYFSQELRDQIIARFVRVLRNDGWFVLSPSEVPLMNNPGLTAVHFPGAIFFRKGASGQKKTALAYNSLPGQAKKKEQRFSIAPVAIARKSPSDHSLMTELKEAITSEVSQFVTQEKDKKTHEAKESREQQNMLHEVLALYADGAYDEAAMKLNQIISHGQSIGDALSLNPGSMALLARAYANQGKLDEAKKWCTQAINAEKLLPGHYWLEVGIH